MSPPSPTAPRGFSPAEVVRELDRLRAGGGYGEVRVTVRAGAVVELTLVETLRPGAASPAGGAPAPVRIGPLLSGSTESTDR